MNNNSYIVDGIVFHTGDRVTCEIEDIQITDARLYIDYGRRAFICQNLVSGAEAPDLFGYNWSWVFDLCDTSEKIAKHYSIFKFKKAKIECFDNIIEQAYPKR